MGPNPNILLRYSTLGLANTFVNMSTGISFVERYFTPIFPSSTTSLNQYVLKSKCFILPWCSGSLATSIADWLSICNRDGSLMEYPSSWNRFLYQSMLCPAVTVERYSASVVDSVTML